MRWCREGRRRQQIMMKSRLTTTANGIDRRGFLKCMAWAGTGALCVLQGGVLKSYSLSNGYRRKQHAQGKLSFVQISDSRMAFNKPANPDVIVTLKAAVDKVNALPIMPEFMLHTGDISHLSKPEQFDNVDQILRSAHPKNAFFCSRRARCPRRRWQTVSRTLRKRRKGRRLVQL